MSEFTVRVAWGRGDVPWEQPELLLHDVLDGEPDEEPDWVAKVPESVTDADLEAMDAVIGHKEMTFCRVAVELEIQGSADDAFTVIDGLLDNGFFQDAVSEHDHDEAGPLLVTSALVRPGESPHRGNAIASLWARLAQFRQKHVQEPRRRADETPEDRERRLQAVRDGVTRMRQDPGAAEIIAELDQLGAVVDEEGWVRS